MPHGQVGLAHVGVSSRIRPEDPEGWLGESVKIVSVDERDWELLHVTKWGLRSFGRLKRLGPLLCAICLLGWGCSDTSFSLGGPLVLSISAVTPVAVTDSLVVEFTIVGRNLLGLVVDYGDMQVDSVALLGAQTAGGRVRNLYAAPGQYTVTARVEDAVEGTVTEALVVTINP